MGVEYARKKIKKSILKMAIVTCILGGMISILLIINYDRPASVIVPRVNCEDIGDETLYLTEHYQEQYPHSLVIDYKDEETRMQEFQGNIITIELVRKCVSSFVLSAGFVYLICMLYYAKRGSE